MSKFEKQRKGLALGAIFGLVASLFAGIAPASAAPTPAILINPVLGTSYVTPIDEDLTLAITRNPESSLTAADYALLKYQVVQSSTWSMNIRADQSGGATASAVVNASASAALPVTFFYNGAEHDSSGGHSVSGAVRTQSFVVVPGDVQAGQTQKFSIVLGQEGDTANITSSSPEVTVTVTAFIDYNNDNKYTAQDTIASVATITFRPYASLGAAATVPTLVAGDTSVTPSLTVGSWNHEQFGGRYGVVVNQHLPTGIVTKLAGTAGYEANVPQTFTWSAPVALERAVPIRAASASYTVSAGLVFLKGTSSDENSSSHAVVVADLGSTTVLPAGATAMSFHAVTGDNAIRSTATSFDVRGNSTFTVRLTVSGAISTSNPVATVTFSNTAVSSLKNYSVNGGASVISGTASAISVVVNNVTGVGTFTVATSGFAPGDFISMSARINGLSAVEIAIQPVDLIWTVTADSDYIATAPNTAFAAGVSVTDQFGLKSSLTTQRIKFGWTAGYSGSATNSFVVLSAGEADATLTPSRSPSTGSSTVTYTLQNYSASTGNWTDTAYTDTTEVFVTLDAVTFRAGLAASYSASISYGADFSWSAAINTAAVNVSGSAVVVSGTGLIFKDSAGNTASDSITLPGTSNGVVSFQVTGRMAGTYPITLTAGSATTTSEIVVLPARSDAGSSITWDTTAITAGRTKIVTGKLVDLNGNPVNTTGAGTTAGDSGTASIAVTYAGTAGIPVGSMPTETNASGEFQISVLTSAADSGTFTLTAVYSSAGASTATADLVSSVQRITVGEAAATVSEEQKVNAGSFKGYVAVYAKGYQGQRMSAKIGNDWVVVESLASNFERVVDFTGAGYTIAVRIYIDRVLVDTITVTTK